MITRVPLDHGRAGVPVAESATRLEANPLAIEQLDRHRALATIV
ncbi:MAG: hypothetical protein ABWY57_14485 [Mycetocola sp.]